MSCQSHQLQKAALSGDHSGLQTPGRGQRAQEQRGTKQIAMSFCIWTPVTSNVLAGQEFLFKASSSNKTTTLAAALHIKQPQGHLSRSCRNINFDINILVSQ